MQGLRVRADRLGWCDVFIALALVVAVVRSVIPPGFMPAMERGEMTLVLCTIDGMTTAGSSDGSLNDVMAGVHAPCAFAHLATLAPPPSAPIVSLPVAIEQRLVRVDETPPSLGPPLHRPQAPRAPPVVLT